MEDQHDLIPIPLYNYRIVMITDHYPSFTLWHECIVVEKKLDLSYFLSVAEFLVHRYPGVVGRVWSLILMNNVAGYAWEK